MRMFYFIIISIFLLFAQEKSFAHEHKLIDAGNGYCYTFGIVCDPYYTENENFELPKEKSVAEARFQRRKEYIEKWYLEYRPDDVKKHNWFIEVPAGLLVVATFPISFLLLEWLDEKHRSRPEEIEKTKQSNIRHEKACEEMHEFIIKDCILERKEVINQNGPR